MKQEVRVGPRGWVWPDVHQLDAQTLGIPLVKLEFVEHTPHEPVQSLGHVDLLYCLGRGQGIGAEEGPQEERVLGHIAPERIRIQGPVSQPLDERMD